MSELNELLNAALVVAALIFGTVLPFIVKKVVIDIRVKFEEFKKTQPAVLQMVLEAAAKFAIMATEAWFEEHSDEIRTKFEVALETAEKYLISMGYDPDFLPLEEALRVWFPEAQQDYKIQKLKFQKYMNSA